MRAQALPRRSQVPRPISGMRAPLASTDGVLDGLHAHAACDAHALRQCRMRPDRVNRVTLAFPPQHRKRHVRRLIQQLQQRPRRAARMALALLPVAHRLDRHADAGGEFGLSQAGLRAHPAGVAGIDLRRPLGRDGWRQDARVGLRRHRRHRPLAAVGEDFDQTSVGFQSHPHHRRLLWFRSRAMD